jgi:hypothetical protein
MSDDWERSPEYRKQIEAQRRVEPYMAGIHGRIAQIQKAMLVGDLTLVLPESDWEGVDAEERPVVLLGCRVVLADVPTAMVAMPVPKGQFHATIPADETEKP